LRLAAAGGALGLVGALFAGRALASLLHEVSPRDPVALGGAALLLAAIAAAVALPPVVRSARLDPAAVLRDE
jgi:predicted lysophospholipase L1 biosynthesis ABC-type transport system permease subunit